MTEEVSSKLSLLTRKLAEVGQLKGEIADKLDGLSKDKDIVTYCTTGVRAEMAFNVLKEKGYKVRYLDANVAPDKKGGFSISK